MNKPEYIIVHTAALKGDDYDIRDIDHYHRVERGWRMVGYHYFICKDGIVQKGRPDDMVGAHCRDKGMNRRSIGVCLQGHGDYEHWTDRQWDAFDNLCMRLQMEYGIKTDHVIGHRETGSNKTCPGKKIDMDAVRSYLRNAKHISGLKPVYIMPPEGWNANNDYKFTSPDAA